MLQSSYSQLEWMAYYDNVRSTVPYSSLEDDSIRRAAGYLSLPPSSPPFPPIRKGGCLVHYLTAIKTLIVTVAIWISVTLLQKVILVKNLNQIIPVKVNRSWQANHAVDSKQPTSQ